jgi:hypothetical protein
LALIEAVARTLPPIAKAEFWHCLSTQLNEAPSDAEVEAAIRFALDQVRALPFLCCGETR